MKEYMSPSIRNIVLLGHSGSGKTTLSEAMAHISGILDRQGQVSQGNTISDFDAEEIQRGFSIQLSCLPIEWEKQKINILDTPGYFDFVGEAKEAVRVSDGAIIVVSGKSGVEVGTEMAWDYAQEMKLPTMFFITDMDDAKADLNRVLEQLKERFGKKVAPFQVPIRENDSFTGFVNVVTMEGRRFQKEHIETCPVPDGMSDQIQPVRDMIMEAVAESDEELMDKYFADEAFTQDEIRNALHQGLIDRSIVPVLCGSGVQNIGVGVLLSAIAKYMPAPKEEHDMITALDANTQENVDVKCLPDESFSALVFKTMMDPYIGRISMLRVYSGTLKKNMTILDSRTHAEAKATHIYVIRGKEQIEVESLVAGDIGAVVKMEDVETGDTLCDPSREIILESIQFPEGVAYRAIVPKTKGDEDKIASGLHRLMEEDPTIHVERDSENEQELIYGIGGQHLEIAAHRLKEKYNVEVDLLKPKVPYRETITDVVEVRGRHKKQSGGSGQYGDVVMRFEPLLDMETSYVFEEKVFGGSVPKNYFPAVEKGIEESVKHGLLAGYPMVGVKAILLDGSYHPVDSSEIAFKMAAQIAYREGIPKAKPILLEPIVAVKVYIPEDYVGDIMGDLTKRRGRVMGMSPEKGKEIIEAKIPLSEIYGYSTDLRSMTQGRGTFTMVFDAYQPMPKEEQNRVIEETMAAL